MKSNSYKQKLFKQRIKYTWNQLNKLIPELEFEVLHQTVFAASASGVGGKLTKKDVIRQKKFLAKAKKLAKKLAKKTQKNKTIIGNIVSGSLFRARASRATGEIKDIYSGLKGKFKIVTGRLNQVNRATFDSSAFVDAWTAKKKGESETSVDHAFEVGNQELREHQAEVKMHLKSNEFLKKVK